MSNHQKEVYFLTGADAGLALAAEAEEAAASATGLVVPAFEVLYGPCGCAGLDSTSFDSFLPPNSITVHCAARFASPACVPLGALFSFTV